MRAPAEPFHVDLAVGTDLERRLRDAGGDAERAATAVARGQRGCISRRQLARLGISRDMIRRRTRRGLLRPVFRGAYLWGGGVEAPGARETAAILAGRHQVVLAGESAGSLWDACRTPEVVTVIPTRGAARSRPGLAVIRSRTLGDGDVVWRCGLPVTSPLRTLYDLAAHGCPRLESIASAMHASGLIDPAALADFARSHRRLPGGARLRRLASLESVGFTRSQNERRLRAICREAKLPQPATNRKLAGWEVDFLWPTVGLVLEVDSFNTHGGAGQFERDRRKQRALVAAGFPVLRITDGMLHREPIAVVADIAAAIVRLERAADNRA